MYKRKIDNVAAHVSLMQATYRC